MMAEGASDTKAVPEASSEAAHVDLAGLDDKHLSQYRHPNERKALVAIIVGMAAIVAVLMLARPYLGDLLSFVPNPFIRLLNDWLHPTRFGLILVGALVVMAIMDIVGQSSRAWQLVARAVEVTPTTFPQLAPIADDLRKRFDLPRTRVYVSRDAPVNGYTIGVREPFAIVFSSIGIASLTPDEFKFCLGREMGSIKLGHTTMATLLGNVRMSLPQPFAFLLKFRSVLFGTYHHAQELSCDRIGIVATRDVRPALSTLIKQNLGQVRGAKIDIKSLAPQTEAIQQGMSGRVLRAAMLLNAQPFAVARLTELVKWAGEPVPAVASTPTAPPPPTPAASAAAAAASAAAAAASAAAAAASAAEAAASAALAAGVSPTSTSGADQEPIAPTSPSPQPVSGQDVSPPASSPDASPDGTQPRATAAPAASGAPTMVASPAPEPLSSSTLADGGSQASVAAYPGTSVGVIVDVPAAVSEAAPQAHEEASASIASVPLPTDPAPAAPTTPTTPTTTSGA